MRRPAGGKLGCARRRSECVKALLYRRLSTVSKMPRECAHHVATKLRERHTMPNFIRASGFRSGFGGEMFRQSQQDRTQRGRTVMTMLPAMLLVVTLGVTEAQVKAGDDHTTVSTSVSAPGDYRLGPEDVIDVFVWKEPELSTTVTVRPDGKISLPAANELVASGKTASELQQDITQRLQAFVTQPVVSVMVKQINSLKISVLGEVRKPNVYRIQSRLTVLDAIALAGGFTDLAKPNKVVVLRHTPAGVQRFKVNVKDSV